MVNLILIWLACEVALFNYSLVTFYSMINARFIFGSPYVSFGMIIFDDISGELLISRLFSKTKFNNLGNVNITLLSAFL